MDISSLLKKRVIFFLISLIFVMVITVVSSYAFVNNEINGEKIINSNNLQIVYENGKVAVEKSSYPMSVDQGIKEAPSNIIRIINKSKYSAKFSLVVSNKDKKNNNLSFNKIYYSVNGSNPQILGNAENGIVYSATIEENKEYKLDVKIWAASEYISNEDQGKKVDLKFEVLNK